MTLEFWISSEKWYQLWAPLLLGIILLLSLAAAFSVARWRTRGGKRALLVCLSGAGIAGALILVNNARYEPYLEPASHVTPLIRHMQYKPFQGYQPLTRSTIDAYSRYHDAEGVMETGLYEEGWIREPVTFLGKQKRHFYFEINGELFKQYESSVIFDETAKETALVGSVYQLKDQAFESIGFRDTHYIFYDHIVIAERESGKVYHPEDEFLVPTVKDLFLDWTFRYY